MKHLLITIVVLLLTVQTFSQEQNKVYTLYEDTQSINFNKNIVDYKISEIRATSEKPISFLLQGIITTEENICVSHLKLNTKYKLSLIFEGSKIVQTYFIYRIKNIL